MRRPEGEFPNASGMQHDNMRAISESETFTERKKAYLKRPSIPRYGEFRSVGNATGKWVDTIITYKKSRP